MRCPEVRVSSLFQPVTPVILLRLFQLASEFTPGFFEYLPFRVIGTASFFAKPSSDFEHVFMQAIELFCPPVFCLRS